MNRTDNPVGGIKVGLGIALLAASTGCVGYAGGRHGQAVMVPGPEVRVVVGSYDERERGHDVHAYSRRGSESRASAHPAGGKQDRQDKRDKPGEKR